MSQSVLTVDERRTDGGIACRRTSSPTSRDPLVLVMGYAGSSRIWPSTFVGKLAECFEVITYDNRGTGASIIPNLAEEYTIKLMADDLFEVVKLFEVERHHLLGYSMGSCIALQFIHDHPELVKSLFLLSGTAGGSLFAKPDKEISLALANPQGDTLWDMYLSSWRLMYSPEVLDRCLPALRAIYENSKDTPTPVAALLGHSHAFRGFDGTTYLPSIKVATTVLSGNTDRLMPVKNSINLAGQIPGCRSVFIDDCEHGPHIQCEDQVVAEIERTAGY